MDRIMSALEYLRMILPNQLKCIPKSANYYIVPFKNLNDSNYPVLAVGSKNQEIMNQIPDFIDLYDEVKQIVLERITLGQIKIIAQNPPKITWLELQKVKYYPNFTL